MKKNFATAILISIILALVLGFALISITSISVSAQNASSKPLPRLPKGKPDFTGTWDHPRVADVTKDVKRRCVGEMPGCFNIGSGELAGTPVGKDDHERKDKCDYVAHCKPSGQLRSYHT